MEFFIENPLFLVAIMLVVLAVLARIISKPNKKKNVHKKAVEQTAKTDENAEKETGVFIGESEQVIQTEMEEEAKKEKKKLKRLKPEITKVYEKKKLQPTDDSKTKILDEKSQKEEEILKSMQFVKTSKNVSKLKPLTATELEERKTLSLEQEFLSQQEVQEDFFEEKVDFEQKSTHFDRSRRLSKIIKNDTFDDMFCSHISEKYMNMNDLEKHLRNCDEMQLKLFERVAETIANSESKVLIDDNGKIDEKQTKEERKSIIENRRREQLANFMAESDDNFQEQLYEDEDIVQDDIDLSARNILIVDAILKRKGKKNNS